MQIEYREEKYQIRHDGRIFTIDEAIQHFSFNGHSREPANFIVSFSRYGEARRIAESIEEIFNKKQARRR